MSNSKAKGKRRGPVRDPERSSGPRRPGSEKFSVLTRTAVLAAAILIMAFGCGHRDATEKTGLGSRDSVMYSMILDTLCGKSETWDCFEPPMKFNLTGCWGPVPFVHDTIVDSVTSYSWPDYCDSGYVHYIVGDDYRFYLVVQKMSPPFTIDTIHSFRDMIGDFKSILAGAGFSPRFRRSDSTLVLQGHLEPITDNRWVTAVFRIKSEYERDTLGIAERTMFLDFVPDGNRVLMLTFGRSTGDTVDSPDYLTSLDLTTKEVIVIHELDGHITTFQRPSPKSPFFYFLDGSSSKVKLERYSDSLGVELIESVDRPLTFVDLHFIGDSLVYKIAERDSLDRASR